MEGTELDKLRLELVLVLSTTPVIATLSGLRAMDVATVCWMVMSLAAVLVLNWAYVILVNPYKEMKSQKKNKDFIKIFPHQKRSQNNKHECTCLGNREE